MCICMYVCVGVRGGGGGGGGLHNSMLSHTNWLTFPLRNTKFVSGSKYGTSVAGDIFVLISDLRTILFPSMV